LDSLARAMHSKRSVFGHTIEGAKAAFAAFDRDGSGTLTPDELAHVSMAPLSRLVHVTPTPASSNDLPSRLVAQALKRLGLGLSDEQIGEVGAALDVNADGAIDYAELAAFVRGEVSPPPTPIATAPGAAPSTSPSSSSTRPSSPAWSPRQLRTGHIAPVAFSPAGAPHAASSGRGAGAAVSPAKPAAMRSQVRVASSVALGSSLSDDLRCSGTPLCFASDTLRALISTGTH
jgi:Ca2+-binding EF-hand superfamily protein